MRSDPMVRMTDFAWSGTQAGSAVPFDCGHLGTYRTVSTVSSSTGASFRSTAVAVAW